MAELSVKWKRAIFAGAFLVLIVLSVDFWNWGSSRPVMLGMPFWVFWDILIVLMTGVYYILLGLYIWRD